MIENIQTGSEVNVKIVNQPTNDGAKKTLVRLLSKDEKVRTENKRLRGTRKKNVRLEQRAGRKWAVNLVKQRPIKAVVGESGTIKASYDVIKDLKSVERFIEVAA